MKHKLFLSVALFLSSLIIFGQGTQIDSTSDIINEKVLGYGFLKRIPGLWHGPVWSDTPAGSFDNWFVDFRPISASQVSQYSMLDSNTTNNLSFFIVKHNNQLKVAMRTDACFRDKCCVTYEVMDSVSESSGYYRFSDFVKGTKRAYSEFTFANNELDLKVYTNKFNKLLYTELHSIWTAKLGNRDYMSETVAHFDYPQPIMVKDFSNVFKGMTESIFFSFANDPYKSSEQPYAGSATVNIAIDKNLETKATDEICLLLTTEPIFDGIKYKKEKLKYISKFVFLTLETSKYVIKNIHPGKYYIYSYLDRNNDRKHMKGDYMNSNATNTFKVLENGNTPVNTIIDFIIP